MHCAPAASLFGGIALGGYTRFMERSSDGEVARLDLRVGKVLRYGRTRANISLDLYNLFNKGTITGASFSYATWLAPSSVNAPRLAKVSVTFDF